jgi:hypothetical protein
MNPLLLICSFISLFIGIIVFLPFFTGPGGSLQDASASDDLSSLFSRETAILERWLRDEAGATAGEISAVEWRQRQRYLTSRYVDVARRISWLKSFQTSEQDHSGEGL